jgi:hypothetical protein
METNMASPEWKSILLLLCAAAGVSMPQSSSATKANGEGEATRVTLTRRAATGGPYGTSAYSFQFESQDIAVHHNAVDLVFNNCGLVHVTAYGGQKNRVARVPGKKLADVDEMPTDGWLKSCFRPEKDAMYVLEIDDGSVRFPVKFRVVEAKSDKVTIEWMPFHGKAGENGTMGFCGGEHGPS